MRRESSGLVLHRRFISAVLAASIGAVAGYLYSQVDLPPELRSGSFAGMYATAGAAIAVLAVRLFSLGKSIVQDYLRDRRE